MTANSEIVWNIVWFFVLCCIVAYSSYSYFHYLNNSNTENSIEIHITDIIKNSSEHHLSGSVAVPTPCHELSVRTHALSPEQYRLQFTTWQESARACEPIVQSRQFDTVVFAPGVGVIFSATFNGASVPIHVSTQY